MNELTEIKKIWQEASRKIEENNRLTRSIITKAIESKSQDVIAQFLREKKTGLIGGAIVIPAMMVSILVSFPITWYSILLLIILGGATGAAVWEGLKHIRKMRKVDESGSLQDSLDNKTRYLQQNFKRGKYLAPTIGFGFYIPVTLIYRYMEYGSLHMETNDIIVLCISLLLIIGITLGIIKFQEYKYVQPLKECLRELKDLDPPAVNRRPRVNIGIVILIILLINIVLYILAKFL
ncbi:MAG: hypothetical protein HOK84_07290 [Bacteroidetes bacterium]|jgi:hypothetical protein|nr:hypothetical protein [Bacteroidota bacterium]MBT4410291.1 hypothetical protein [Bacteroidota bacterium]MBT5425982.1 hypothetical protein [Bacteroidota bacterium]